VPTKFILHRSDCGLLVGSPRIDPQFFPTHFAALVQLAEMESRMLEVGAFFQDRRGPFAWVRMQRGCPLRDLCTLSIPAWDDYLWFGPDRKWFESLGFVVERGGSRAAMCERCSVYVPEDSQACLHCGPFTEERSWATGRGCSVVLDKSDPFNAMFGVEYAASHG
jgi:RNA polymerase subunit RPABC4/transcription elongation factor Spt4